MIIQGLNWYANTSAFIQWVVLGIIINYVDFKCPAWLKGIIIAEMVTLPTLVIVSQNSLASLVPIIVMSGILGCLVGYFGGKFTNS
jgi:hydrogenase/urease accessory protein HupE